MPKPEARVTAVPNTPLAAVCRGFDDGRRGERVVLGDACLVKLPEAGFNKVNVAVVGIVVVAFWYLLSVGSVEACPERSRRVLSCCSVIVGVRLSGFGVWIVVFVNVVPRVEVFTSKVIVVNGSVVVVIVVVVLLFVI